MQEAFLKKIVEVKKREVEIKKRKLPLERIKGKIKVSPPCRNFKKAVFGKKGVRVIAEIKRCSPSCGVIRDNLSVGELARIYEENGACSLSVLTDKNFFGGNLCDLKKVREVVSLPLLAKEFIIDEYQIYEARLYGADCILLIARLLDEDVLGHLCQVVENLGMSFIVEVHLPCDVKKIPTFSPSLIVGINNRNLDTLKIDLKVTLRILKLLPSGFPVISESGITSREDIDFLRKEGMRASLVGEALLRSKEPGRKLRKLLYGED